MYICWSDGSESRNYKLSDGETVIGRRPDCQIVINDVYVSRRHAQIVGTAGKYTIADLRSTYGTFVNGNRIVAEQVLEAGDRIELGRDRFPLIAGLEATKYPVDPTAGFERALLDLKLEGQEQPSVLERISWILDLQQWGRALTPATAFDQILHSALKLSGAERAFILVRIQDGFGYAAGMQASGARLSEAEFQTSRSVVDQVARTETSVFMVERLEDAFAAQASIIATGAKAIACLPLEGIPGDAGGGATVGILYLDSTKPMHTLSGLDEKILKKLASDAGNVLERIELVHTIEQRKTFERELALAQETQRALLPRVIPTVAGWELAGFSTPTRYVGGDFYDFIRTHEGSFIAALGDVSGKGVSAALVSSMVLGSLHAQIHSQKSIEAAANACNLIMKEKSPVERFVTFFLAEFDQDGRGQYISAGHTTGYVYRRASDTVEELPSNNMLVGALDFPSFQCSPIGLENGDVLISYSDGLTEAENDRGEPFGEQRVLASLRAAGGSGAAALLEHVVRDIEGFIAGRDQTDDITIMTIGRVK